MTNTQASNPKHFDLEDRTLKFAKEIIKLCKQLPSNTVNFKWCQLQRSQRFSRKERFYFSTSNIQERSQGNSLLVRIVIRSKSKSTGIQTYTGMHRTAKYILSNNQKIRIVVCFLVIVSCDLLRYL